MRNERSYSPSGSSGHSVQSIVLDSLSFDGKQAKDMQAVNESTTEVFGLYELADDGTVLYSRPRFADGLHMSEPAVVGRDFFRDIFPCENKEDLRRHFRRFITGDRPVDHFVFECMFEREIVRAKVFMTRARENDHDHAGEIVIMDIRQAA